MEKTTEKTVEQVLQEARVLIDKGWIKGSFACNESMIAVDTTDEKASCFCILGALRRVEGLSDLDRCYTDNYTSAREVILEVLKPRGYDFIPTFNDSEDTTKEDVLKVFDEAIEIEIAKENQQ